jgi:hypothetical protein
VSQRSQQPTASDGATFGAIASSRSVFPGATITFLYICRRPGRLFAYSFATMAAAVDPQKKALRTSIKAKMKAVTEADLAACSERACARLTAMDVVQRRCVAAGPPTVCCLFIRASKSARAVRA